MIEVVGMSFGSSLRGIGEDFVQMIATLAILLSFVALFWLWSNGGMWLLVVVLVVAILGFVFYKAYRSGYINL